jgi:hypothetical protein
MPQADDTNHSARSLRETVTYWAPGATDGFGGLAFVAPVTVAGRWLVRDTMFINETGKEARSEHLVVLGQDVAMRGYLFQGTSAGADPLVVAGAREIRAFRKTGNVANRRFKRTALL